MASHTRSSLLPSGQLSCSYLTLTEETAQSKDPEGNFCSLPCEIIVPATEMQIYAHTLPLKKKKNKLTKDGKEKEAWASKITRRQKNTDFNLDVSGNVEVQEQQPLLGRPQGCGCPQRRAGLTHGRVLRTTAGGPEGAWGCRGRRQSSGPSSPHEGPGHV